jgi:two-component system chemotaxis sensor kinase CheA
MEFSEEELEEILSIFQQESEEQIQNLNDNMLRLEANPKDARIIQEIFREAHSLKGAARMIGLDDVQVIAHKLEDIFGLARNNELEIIPELIDIMCSAVDAIASIIEDSIKNKGTHKVDVTAILTQLKMIETGEFTKLLGAHQAQIAINAEPEESEDDYYEEEEEDKFPQFELRKKDPERSSSSPEDKTIDSRALDTFSKLNIPVSKTKTEEIAETIEEELELSKNDFSEEELAELKQIFYAESRENIDFIFKSLERLKLFPYDREILAEVYRSAHSLEGSTRFIKFDEIKEIAHSIRDILEEAVKEELFINADMITKIEKYLLKVKEIIEEKYDQEGYETSLNLDQLEKQIEEKMNTYKKGNDKPKKSHKKKIALSSDALDFNEEEVLKDLGVKPLTEEEQKEEAKAQKIVDDRKKEESKKQLEIDPLSLTDEEIGDLELGALEGIKPKVPPEGLEKEEDKMPKNVYWSSAKPPPTEKPGKESIETLLQYLTDDLNILSHNENNKSALQKTIENIKRTKDLAYNENRQELLAIIAKIDAILSEVSENKILFSKEMATVIAQSIEASTAIVNFSEDTRDEIIDDPSLIYQRLMILHQTARLSAGIPFEEELEPEIFQDNYTRIRIEENTTEQPSITETKESKEIPKTEPQEIQTTRQITTPPAAQVHSSMFTPKTNISPTGQMTPAKDTGDSAETYTIKTLRVDTRKLDQLVAQVGELIIAKIKAKERLTDIEKLLHLVDEWQRDWAKTKYTVKNISKKPASLKKSTFMPEGTSIYTPGKDMNAIIRENSDRLAHLTNYLNQLYRNIQEDDTRLTLIINELENRIKNVRLLPLATIFNMYPRMVRDLAREQKKEIELEVRGSETTVDKKIIEEIKSPLMHLIRNAIDHGIESPEDREKNAKPASGKLLLNARHLENSVLIEIIDDGRGIDIEKIKTKVLEKELLTPSELAAMSETQIMNIIFWPGFSTGEEVTDISGRGVGMDVVHTKITQLNGKVKVTSKLGEGCRVSIQLPVTMSTIQVFLIRLKGQTYAVPTSAIQSAVLINPEEVFFKEGREAVLVGGLPVFLYNLSDLLELPKDSPNRNKKDKITVLVLQTEDMNIGFKVDGLLGDQEILHKNLEPPLMRVRNVAGVTTLGSGEVCLILNVGDLVKTAQMTHGMALKASLKQKDSESGKKDILVVDDSVTTRILERNILRAAGYNVTVAVNGLDALTKLTTQHFDLVVSDVEMPDISGYELTKRIKKDEMLSNIPVILVTSLASEVDRQKGLAAGASDYITKGGFDQEELLGTIRRLLN